LTWRKKYLSSIYNNDHQGLKQKWAEKQLRVAADTSAGRPKAKHGIADVGVPSGRRVFSRPHPDPSEALNSQAR
jgi:hypothetical protein